MKRFGLLLILLLSAAALSADVLDLTRYAVYYTPDQKFAAQELSQALEKMTGKKYTPAPRISGKGQKYAFMIGRSREALQSGINLQTLSPDEWVILKKGERILLFGGSHRGSLYAVYEFLERFGKCSWPAWDVEIIPSQKTIKVPAGLRLRGKPAFEIRTIFDGVNFGNKRFRSHIVEKKTLWDLRNRETAAKGTQQFDTTKRYYYTHNLFVFVPPAKYYAAHPEYFAMNDKGKRFVGKSLHAWSQLCLSNKDVARITAQELLKHIRADRKNLPKDKWPRVYPVSQLDGSDYICKCPECSAITKREKSESALVILYLNRVLDKIGKEFPDVRITTLFYTSTEEAPRTMKPHKNLICQWCDLYLKSDCYRPITSAFNKDQKRQIEAWKKIAAPGNLAIWDYHNMSGTVAPPRLETVIDAIPADLRYYHSIGLRRYFTEMEDGTVRYGAAQMFLDMQYYVLRRLLIDPEQDAEKLIRHYMKSCYGPAAGIMTKLLDAIRQQVKAEPNALCSKITVRAYQTDNFLRRMYGLWKQALAATTPGSNYRRYVEQEGLIILAASLRQTGLLKGAERQKMKDEFRRLAQKRIKFYLAPEQQKKTMAELEKTLRQYDIAQIVLPVPEIFKNVPKNELHVYGYPHFRQMVVRRGEQPFIVDDPVSPVRKAVTPPPASQPAYKKYKPRAFGVYDYGTKTAMVRGIAKIPQDEKYHWHYIGVADVKPASFFWAFRWVLQADFSGVWQLSDGDSSGNKWHVYVSARFTGPVYVKNSKSPNKLFVDYVVITKKKIALPK